MRCPVRKRRASFFISFTTKKRSSRRQQELAPERVSYIPEQSAPL